MERRQPGGRLIALLVVLAVVWPRSAAPQSVASSPTAPEVQWLRPGAYVYVTDARGHRVGGRLQAVSADALILGTGASPREFRVNAIAKVEHRDSIENGVWLGLGAGLAALTAACTFDRDREHCPYRLYYFGLPALAAGATLGALLDLSVHRTVAFGAAGRAVARFRLRPTLNPHPVGITASVSITVDE